MIRYFIDEVVFDAATARQRLVTVDPQARFAIAKFPDAEKLLELAKNKIAELSRKRRLQTTDGSGRQASLARPLNIGASDRSCY